MGNFGKKDYQESEQQENNGVSLGAVIFLSGLLLYKQPEKEIFKYNKFPIFVYHGTDDDMIDCEYTIEPFQKLFESNDEIELYTEEITHTVSETEWYRLKKYLQKFTIST